MKRYTIVGILLLAAFALLAQVRYNQIYSGDRHGTGAMVQMFTGSSTSGNLGKFDANGNLIDGGAIPAAESTTVSNSGAGAQILKTSTNVTARTIVAGTNMTVTQGTDTVTLDAAGVTVIPTGAVMMFNLSACPSGWSELVAARGRYLVGMPLSGTLAASVGTALSNTENRPVGQHTHNASGGSHDHYYNAPSGTAAVAAGAGYSLPSTTTSTSTTASAVAVTVDNAGSVSGTNAPYLQLLTCSKN